ncbi:pyrophosphatase PpaX [Bacillaceae bacterium Marseille-Q3522]|nr:pyrophosphatase PpaX [Bacillaceae bacterium Marseille-Q3522]
MSTEITTALFDLDGTLIDTNELIKSSYSHTLNKYFPDKYSDKDILSFMGPSLYYTFSAIDKERTEELIHEYRTYNKANHDLYVKEFPGVYETIKTMSQAGIKLGIVTTKMFDVVQMGLKLTKLDAFFDVIVALDHVKKEKPDPEPVEKALAQLKSFPEEAIMVGDHFNDILAGKNAGTKTAAVSWSLKSLEVLLQYQPDYLLKKMPDLLDVIGVKTG